MIGQYWCCGIDAETYKEWTEISRLRLKKTIRECFNNRFKECENKINQSLQPQGLNFKISKSIIDSALERVYESINRWPGVDVEKLLT